MCESIVMRCLLVSLLFFRFVDGLISYGHTAAAADVMYTTENVMNVSDDVFKNAYKHLNKTYCGFANARIVRGTMYIMQ